MRSRKPSAVTEQQEKYVEARVSGLNVKQAQEVSDYSGSEKTVEAIRHQLQAARSWLTNTTQITRLNVIEGFIDGIEMARMQGDSGNVIKGWVEVGKVLGHYAPEVKRIELTMDQGRLKSKFEGLSDSELLAIQQGRVLDGECTEVE